MSIPAKTKPSTPAIKSAWLQLLETGSDLMFLTRIGALAQSFRDSGVAEYKINDRIDAAFLYEVDVLYSNYIFDKVSGLRTRLAEVIDETSRETDGCAVMTTNRHNITYILILDSGSSLAYSFDADDYTVEQVGKLERIISEVLELGLGGGL